MYHFGQGVEKNPTEARKWYKKSAELNQECWGGMRMYAEYLMKGLGGPADQLKGFEYLLKASQGGDTLAKQDLEDLTNNLKIH